eukprot:jgi/Chlat1/2814/Chrsp187S00201
MQQTDDDKAVERGMDAQPDASNSPSASASASASFLSMGLDARLQRALKKRGYVVPTAVQARMVPLALDGKDVLARAATGSGKTLAYLLPALHRLLVDEVDHNSSDKSSNHARALILVPTKELCAQVAEEASSLAMLAGGSLRVANFALSPNATAADIIISTPAKARQAMHEGRILLNNLEIVILDEADLLLSYGYEQDIKDIAAQLPRAAQCFLLSATANTQLKELQQLVLHNPVVLNVEEENAAAGNTGARAVQHFAICCKESDKLLHALAVLKLGLVPRRVLIFVNTVDGAFRLRLFLERFGIRAALLNAELPLNSRHHMLLQMEILKMFPLALLQFNRGLFDYLIATDDTRAVAHEAQDADGNKKKSKKSSGDSEYGVVRGVDFKEVRTVFNYDMPSTAESYVHRVGRTGRAGAAGLALSFVRPQDEEVAVAAAAAVKTDALAPFPSLTSAAVDALRYRAEDTARAVTRAAVKEARAKELKLELLNSERLKTFFEDHPADRALLLHDTPLSKHPTAPELKQVPSYLQDPTASAAGAAVQSAEAAAGSRQRGLQTRLLQKRRKQTMDPLKSFAFAKVRDGVDERPDVVAALVGTRWQKQQDKRKKRKRGAGGEGRASEGTKKATYAGKPHALNKDRHKRKRQ